MPDVELAASWPPRWLTRTDPAEAAAGDGAEACEFISHYGRIVKDSVAGRTGAHLVLRPWQVQLTSEMLARRPDGRYRHRTALIGVPRKNGKSAWLQEIGKWGLLLGPDGGEVYSCAADRDQARIVFAGAKRSIEMVPELAEQVKLYRDAIEVPATGSVWRVLSAEAYTKEGLSPTLVLFDEVHAQPSRDLWDVMALAAGARVDPLMVGITTAGARTDSLGNDSLCYGLYQHGRRVASGEADDPSFFFAWWEPAAGDESDHTSPDVWAEANPGYGDIVDPEDFVAAVARTPEPEFRTKRTNLWVTSNAAALPHGAWDACFDPERLLDPSERQVLFVDGSWSGDCTAIVAASVEPQPHLEVVGLWERPDDDQHWRVPVNDVKAVILDAARERNVRGVCFDPFRWQQTMADLEDEGVLVIEWPTNATARIVPAWKSFYDAVLDRQLTHGGDPAMARHIENMRLKIDAKGARPVKEHRASGRHIDLGICAVGAFTEALAPDEPELDFVGAWT